MEHTKSEAKPKEIKTKFHEYFDSNPFTVTNVAIKKLLKLNTNTLVGLVFFDALLILIALVTFGALVASGAAYGIKHSWFTLPDWLAQFNMISASMNDLSIFTTSIIGLALLLLTLTLMNTMQLILVMSSVEEHEISFKELLILGAKRVPLLMAFYGLVIAALAAIVLALILLAFLGPIIFALAAVAIAFIIYVYFRIALTPYLIVDESLAPIKAIKKSWKLSANHTVEVMGIFSISAVISTIPALLFVFNGIISDGSLSILAGLVTLLVVLVSLALHIASFAGIAERFVQLRNLQSGEIGPSRVHVSNYLAILLFFIVSGLVKQPSTGYNFGPNYLPPAGKQFYQRTNTNPTLPSLDRFDSNNPIFDPQDSTNFN